MSIESNLAKAHLSRILEARDIDGAVRAIAPTMSLARKNSAGEQAGFERRLIRAEAGELARLMSFRSLRCRCLCVAHWGVRQRLRLLAEGIRGVVRHGCRDGDCHGLPQ